MSTPQTARSPIYLFLPVEIEGFDSLAELALDIRWSWNHSADELWRHLDPVLWDLTHNPWAVLQAASRERLGEALTDRGFRRKVEALLGDKSRACDEPAWFQRNHAQSPLTNVAYFSMEFMLSEALPIYSGGLGNVAGDQLKAASDLGVPVTGVGLLYQQGYFRQVINKDGAQEALFPYNAPGQLPITPLREPNGEWLRLRVALPGYSVWLRAWQVQAGRVKLYLLDSNDLANLPAHRGITSELYGGGPEVRMRQELVLGIGGWRLLETLGLRPEVCHLNEGHAAFVVLARARSYMEETGVSFDTALAVTRAGNLFTTHTPVDAGFDRFHPSLVERYLGSYAEQRLGVPIRRILALGRRNPEDAAEDFNMAYLALRGSGAVNGVSRLHGKVSRRIFQPLFPRWPEAEVPVGHVTNGVHMPTWDSAEADELWTRSCGQDRWVGTAATLEEDIREVPDSKLWQLRTAARASLVDTVREWLERQAAASGLSLEGAESMRDVLDPHALTLGFARRFATYKRPTLLLHDPERLTAILTNRERPVQLLIAGKAHPADPPGQAMIREWTRFIRRPEIRRHAAFLQDYDMLVTERLVQGVDVWINTPRRPWEACGTSGMKVLVNGGLNLSELDGWWAEAYSPEVGWALGDGREYGDDPAWDAAEAEALYRLLEDHVVPEFYSRDENGLPAAWVARMRHSMARLTPRFSADRTLREYTERYYLPAARIYRERAAGQGAGGERLCRWLRALEQGWARLQFGRVRVRTERESHLFEVELLLRGLDPACVEVELYADGADGGEPVRQAMGRSDPLAGAADGFLYVAKVPATRPAADYTARVIPRNPGVAIPLEAPLILWQR
ncbi:MAG: alpha-glucan family phosphorylase [bacterium]